MSADLVARALAQAFLIGPWEYDALHELAFRTLNDAPRWVGPLIRAVLRRFSVAPDDPEPIRRFLISGRSFRQHFQLGLREPPPRVIRWLSVPEKMNSPRWPVLPLDTIDDLERWLHLPPSQLEWLADERRYLTHRADAALGHYHRRWLRKRSGGHRLVEAPKPELKLVQKKILREILEQIPAHPTAHGFVRGRSPISHAQLHVGKRVLLRLDLQNFFGTVTFARVRQLFATAGYGRSVSRCLAALCTTSVPGPEIHRIPRPTGPSDLPAFTRLRRDATTRHLPQGAPSSPALANCIAFHLDTRLAAAAVYAGATYSRYADDLAFSWDRDPGRGVERFVTLVATIATEEGFAVQHHKTRVMRPNQRQELAGVVVNQRLNPRRADLERLEAVLTNCVRLGPASQNRDGVPDFRAHLLGRIGWVQALAPEKAAPLRALFERIVWPAA